MCRVLFVFYRSMRRGRSLHAGDEDKPQTFFSFSLIHYITSTAHMPRKHFGALRKVCHYVAACVQVSPHDTCASCIDLDMTAAEHRRRSVADDLDYRCLHFRDAVVMSLRGNCVLDDYRLGRLYHGIKTRPLKDSHV